MKPKIIKTEAEYAQALARLDVIFDAEPETPEGDEAELLTALIEMYEERVHPMGLPAPLEAIQFRMEQQGLRAKDLIPYIGSASKVSEVLSGKRALSLSMIRNLVKLGIPAKLTKRSTSGSVLAFAQSLRISPAIPAGRVRYESKSYTVFKPLIGIGKLRPMFGIQAD